MPPVEPLRERILAGVATVLGRINGADPYWTTPTSPIERSLLAIDQYRARLDAGPVLGVMRSSGSLLTSDEKPFGYLGLYRFTTWGYLRERDGVSAGTWLERLWADHVIALLDEVNAEGGEPTDLRWLVTDLAPGVLDTDDGALEREAFFAQDWTARLHESYGTK